jgi:hypothetical protein
MKLEWANISFVLKKLRETQTFILVGDSVDEVHTVLDDHIVKTQIMKGNTHSYTSLPTCLFYFSFPLAIEYSQSVVLHFLRFVMSII